MKVAFFEVKDWERDYMAAQFPDDQLFFSDERLAEDLLPEDRDFECLSVFIHSRITPAVLDQMPQVKVIATRSTGFDHVDTELCKQRGVAVARVPNYGENTVAEHTFALILSLSRNVHKSYRHAVEGRMDLAALTGFDLMGKTLGVVGAGRIGLHVIKIARGFGMRVLVFDVREDSFLSELLNFSYAPLEQLLAESDIITLHAPYMPATHHVINRDRLALVKRGALLVNTSRGGLVDTDALIQALNWAAPASTSWKGKSCSRKSRSCCMRPRPPMPCRLWSGAASCSRKTTWSSLPTMPSTAAKRWSAFWIRPLKTSAPGSRATA
jgi:D-lactate dehydrogenase